MKNVHKEIVLIAAASLLSFSPYLFGGACGASASVSAEMPAMMSRCDAMFDRIRIASYSRCERLTCSASGALPGLSIYDVQYHQVWELVNRYFLYKERLSDWNAWHYRYDSRMSTPTQAEKAIDEMLDSLKDEYTFYRNIQSTQERRMEDEERNVVTYKMLRGNIGYLHISTFNSKNCVAETRQALKKMVKARALVLDLRENKGGSIDDAFRIFSLFVRKGKFVSMSGCIDGVADKEELFLEENSAVSRRNGTESRFARQRASFCKRPMIVIVNERTKSAAEMLAGALRDQNRAKMIGSKTFGKGIVQRVWEFENGTSVKITAARFYLPLGDAIHGVGIVPDKVVSNMGASDTQLLVACSLLKRTLADHVAVSPLPPRPLHLKNSGRARVASAR